MSTNKRISGNYTIETLNSGDEITLTTSKVTINGNLQVTGGGTFRLPSLTDAEIANILAVNGDMVYNTTVNKIQGYENGAWGNLI